MRKVPLMAVAAVVLIAAGALAQQEQPWQVALDKRHDALVAKNGPGTDAVLRDHLLAMGHEDQGVRFRNINAPADQKDATAEQLAATDRKLTAELQQIVAAHGWPTIQRVGYNASQSAMLILTHSPDHAWQRTMLPKLEELAHQDRIDGSQVAVAVDKELVSEGKLQRYGSQFKFVDGQAMMVAVEDPANLDKRRAEALLPPMDAYKKLLVDMYHVKMSDMIVRP
jgi:hypothetical protein